MLCTVFDTKITSLEDWIRDTLLADHSAGAKLVFDETVGVDRVWISPRIQGNGSYSIPVLMGDTANSPAWVHDFMPRIGLNRAKEKELYLICEIAKDDPKAVEEDEYEAERQRQIPVEAPSRKYAAAKVSAAKVSKTPTTPQPQKKGKQKVKEEEEVEVKKEDPTAWVTEKYGGLEVSYFLETI
jgi:hypothetical protein